MELVLWQAVNVDAYFAKIFKFEVVVACGSCWLLRRRVACDDEELALGEIAGEVSLQRILEKDEGVKCWFLEQLRLLQQSLDACLRSDLSFSDVLALLE